MDKKTVQLAYKNLRKLSKKKASKKKLLFNFESKLLNYESFLTDFSSQHFQYFNEISLELELDKSINKLFNGGIVNVTENRAAQHHQFRNTFAIDEFKFDKLTKPFINLILEGGFENIVTFGIGGSYEGPKLLKEYTENHTSKLNYYFVSGPDKDEFNSVLRPLRGKKNFYIFSSKSLSTEETLLCLRWLGNQRTSHNSIVITANPDKATSLGFCDKSILPFPETVGGRYSIWSPISLIAAIENNFSSFLLGGSLADKMLVGKSKEDKRYQKLVKILAFSDLWFSNFRSKKNRVIFSYNWKLRSLPKYIQQLEMESLGKAANPLSPFNGTGQSIFGGFGSTAQHSYFQLLHQGTAEFCTDIIFSSSKDSPLLSAQAQGQTSLLSLDSRESRNLLEKTNSNSPVNLFHLNKLSLASLGFLLATWEHRVFTTACMLQINPFDQYGVAAGKRIANKFLS
jgi:glucose-6-phosphate isomerase